MFDDLFLPLNFEIRTLNGKTDLFNETFGTVENRKTKATFEIDLSKLSSPGTFTCTNIKNTPVCTNIKNTPIQSNRLSINGDNQT